MAPYCGNAPSPGLSSPAVSPGPADSKLPGWRFAAEIRRLLLEVSLLTWSADSAAWEERRGPWLSLLRAVHELSGDEQAANQGGDKGGLGFEEVASVGW